MDKENEAHYPLVLVTWVDCTTFRGWHSVEESLKFTPDEVETAGFLLSEEEAGYLRITASLSGKDGNLTLLDAMTIPRAWVTKVEVLGLVSSCGCGEESMVQEKLNEEDCWVTPDPGQQAILDNALEVKPGDDNLGRQLTFDEHIRRGGTYENWSHPSLREEDEKRRDV